MWRQFRFAPPLDRDTSALVAAAIFDVAAPEERYLESLHGEKYVGTSKKSAVGCKGADRDLREYRLNGTAIEL